ncbi:unnamed protein product [Haemonchus placei]|uniref:WD_REPEATS_REGION domain-containing protein n=1 Tax=Haemonchus placei TaxID=6290 RepID=A0A0N4X4U9_HAEPC|nr:unnamed protein product [Haemonchus placei]
MGSIRIWEAKNGAHLLKGPMGSTDDQRADIREADQSRQSGSLSQSSQDEDDPYQEILRTYNDNVSHLVFHGSSLKSMSNIDFESMNQSISTAPSGSCRVRFQDRVDLEGRSMKAAESA